MHSQTRHALRPERSLVSVSEFESVKQRLQARKKAAQLSRKRLIFSTQLVVPPCIRSRSPAAWGSFPLPRAPANVRRVAEALAVPNARAAARLDGAAHGAGHAFAARQRAARAVHRAARRREAGAEGGHAAVRRRAAAAGDQQPELRLLSNCGRPARVHGEGRQHLAVSLALSWHHRRRRVRQGRVRHARAGS
ncbi:hypothetical protein FGB62_7g013 [Gracilaria domingensis]|nr:hypothetical protein FGB62_7g013 [Gracilaria domingensis]